MNGPDEVPMKLNRADFPAVDALALEALRVAMPRPLRAFDLMEGRMNGLSLAQVSASLARLRKAGLVEAIWRRRGPTLWTALIRPDGGWADYDRNFPNCPDPRD